MGAGRTVAPLAYLAPLAVTWLVPQAEAALAAALAIPLGIAAAGFVGKRPALLLHGGQAFHLLAAYALLAAFLGIVAEPGALRWAGPRGSIPLGANPIKAAKVAFWLVALSRSGTLLYLGIEALRGRDVALPFFGRVPAPAPAP
jgi:hypothetical protein